MSKLDRVQLKQTITEFATHGLQQFLQAHPSLVFYAFAFDCNAEEAEVNLCLNTETDFLKTLQDYQDSQLQNDQSDEKIKALRYNTGDWEYQCFDTLHVFTEEQLDAIFQAMPEDNYQTWGAFTEDLLGLFTEALQDFTQTETYLNIPKSTDFMAFCINHDEDIENALRRMAYIER